MLMVLKRQMPKVIKWQILNTLKEEIIIPYGKKEMILSESETKETKTETGIQETLTNTLSNQLENQKPKKKNLKQLQKKIKIGCHQSQTLPMIKLIAKTKLNKLQHLNLMIRQRKNQKQNLKQNQKQNQRKKKHLKQLFKLNHIVQWTKKKLMNNKFRPKIKQNYLSPTKTFFSKEFLDITIP